MKERPEKIIIAWNFLPKVLQHVRQVSKYRRAFE